MMQLSYFPLEDVKISDLWSLGQTLWSWSSCETCQNGRHCATSSCPSQRWKRLGGFFEHYKELTLSYEPDVRPGECPTLRSHNDVLAIIQQLKLDPEINRAQLRTKLLVRCAGRNEPPTLDLERSINLAVRTMTMINCSTQHQSLGLLEQGSLQIPWRDEVAFSHFIDHAFPMTDHPSLNENEDSSAINMKRALMAKKIRKRIGVKFQRTDDLRRHLKLDRKRNILDIYHHTAFLKEHLRLMKDMPRDLSTTKSLRL